ncbi:type II toxin-antitoxin system RelB family antitoxin [Salinisphaera orenii]|uniref:type II toxin-antitoxin system RelB family antitoxin n=1 Tax=Salinisphaera orenii TaxID=856731 RepID=UPI003CCC6F72
MGRTKTLYVLEAVERHIEDLEDIYLAEQIIARVNAGTESTHAIEETECGLGLTDRADQQRLQGAEKVLGFRRLRSPDSLRHACGLRIIRRLHLDKPASSSVGREPC